jgi:hypothetical protein
LFTEYSLNVHLQAVHWCIDELKAEVPIWKKELYSDGETWKENPESRRLIARSQKHNGCPLFASLQRACSLPAFALAMALSFSLVARWRSA